MTYAKPEINLLGDAAQVIQDGTKVLPNDIDDPVRGQAFPAYDLDE
jgi:hypothetical protein